MKRPVKRLGIVVAVEEKTILRDWGRPYREKRRGKFKIYDYQLPAQRAEIIVVISGPGEIRAAAATQILISEYKIDQIINFGVAGSLNPDLKNFSVCLVDKVVHYDFDISANGKNKVGQYPHHDFYFHPKMFSEKAVEEVFKDIPHVSCASGDKFLDGKEAKNKIRDQFGADICDMESAAVAIICELEHAQCLIVKAISDEAEEGNNAFDANVDEAAKICFNLVDKFICLWDD